MKKKSAISLIMAAVLGLTACGNPGADNGADHAAENTESDSVDGADEDDVEADLSETMSFSVFQQADDNPEFSYEESPVMDYWKKMFNIEFTWQFPPQGSEQDQMTVMLGTGDYTDLIDLSFNTENLTTLYEDGVLYDLAPYVEKYMPNYYAYLNDPQNSDVRSALYDDDGRLYTLALIQEKASQWGGLVYRRDILESVTGGNISFPSGNDHPVTIEDWDYMLPLMKQYFDAAGLGESACLIIPAKGYWENGTLLEGFGIGGADYVDNDGKVQYGLAQDAFYDYLVKMKEWYEAGYIYTDFAGRTQDLFYFPNSALTYGGGAGVWYGISAQLGGAMSIPDYNLIMDVQPVASPEIDGVEPIGTNYISRAMNSTGWGVSTNCSEEKLIRIMTACDYFYTEEGAATRTIGLSVEQGASEYEGMVSRGMGNGVRKSGTVEWTEEMDNAADKEDYDFGMNRLPGISSAITTRTARLVDGVDMTALGNDVWTGHGDQNAFPYTVTFTSDETAEYNSIQTNMTDYADSVIPKFIMGREELNEETFMAYQQQLNELGLETYLSVKQAAYDRYLTR